MIRKISMLAVLSIYSFIPACSKATGIFREVNLKEQLLNLEVERVLNEIPGVTHFRVSRHACYSHRDCEVETFHGSSDSMVFAVELETGVPLVMKIHASCVLGCSEMGKEECRQFMDRLHLNLRKAFPSIPAEFKQKESF